MQTITTKVYKYIASASDGEGNEINITSYSNPEQAHAEAALALCKKMGWAGKLQGGHTTYSNNVGRAFRMSWVWLDEDFLIEAPFYDTPELSCK